MYGMYQIFQFRKVENIFIWIKSKNNVNMTHLKCRPLHNQNRLYSSLPFSRSHFQCRFISPSSEVYGHQAGFAQCSQNSVLSLARAHFLALLLCPSCYEPLYSDELDEGHAKLFARVCVKLEQLFPSTAAADKPLSKRTATLTLAIP